MAHQPTGGKGIGIGYGDDLVIDPGVQHLGDKVGPDALDFMGTGLALGQQGGTGGLHGHHFGLGVLTLQVFPHAGHRAAGAHTGNEKIHLAVGILVDLRARGLKMGLGVGGVGELAGDEAAGDPGGQLPGLFHGPGHALGPLGEHQLRPVGLDQLAALHAHGVRHDDDELIPPGRRHRGQADARIAGGGLNKGGPGLQSPGSFRLINDALGDPVLYRPGRIQIFQLGKDGGLQVFRLFNVCKLQQGRAANKLVGRGVDFGHNDLPFRGEYS